MIIDFSWIYKASNLDGYDFDFIRKHCDSDKAANFCWWIKGDLTNSDESFAKIIERIEKSSRGEKVQFWRGNLYILEFSPSNVVLKDPFEKYEYVYTNQEFLEAMYKWQEASRVC